MQDLTLTLIQADLIWEDRDANLAAFDRKINSISEETDLIILPEMFTTGFTMAAEKLAEPMDGPTVSWLLEKAGTKGTHILGSTIIVENGKYYNRLLWATPEGNLLTYDKKHLFRMSGEHGVYAPGSTRLTVPVKGWRLRPFICYDLRFPIWTRNLECAYDLALFVANWPAARAAHWRLLLQARAVENQAYVVGVNRVGKDGQGLAYDGDSAVIDPAGEVLCQQGNAPFVQTVTLNHDRLREYRENFAAWRDADTDLAALPEQA